MSTTKPQMKAPKPPRGMRDLLPKDARRRQYVTSVVREVFELYGFEPLVTPAMEQADLLMGKYGPEAERLIYRARLGEDENLALRYDLTVPLARVVGATPDLPRPFRRYQISPVWRGERPQKGRYREFVQADVDIVGTRSLLADAEIITLVIDVLARLGLAQTVTKINNRQLVGAIGGYAGAGERFQPGILRAIDKLDKVGVGGVRTELLAVGLSGELLNRARQGVGRWLRRQAGADELGATLREAAAMDGGMSSTAVDSGIRRYLAELAAYGQADVEVSVYEAAAAEAVVVPALLAALRADVGPGEVLSEAVIDRLLALLQIEGSSDAVLDELERTLDGPAARQGIGELRAVLSALAASGVAGERYGLDFTMVRGLDYYTGTIFETVMSNPPVGSVTGGGRYDRLLGLFGRETPAVGTSFGIDRLEDVLEVAGVLPPWLEDPIAQVLVTRFDAATAAAALASASALRLAGIRTELFMDDLSVGEQLGYAARRGIPLALIIGPDEVATRSVGVRNMRLATQSTVEMAELVGAVRGQLARVR